MHSSTNDPICLSTMCPLYSWSVSKLAGNQGIHRCTIWVTFASTRVHFHTNPRLFHSHNPFSNLFICDGACLPPLITPSCKHAVMKCSRYNFYCLRCMLKNEPFTSRSRAFLDPKSFCSPTAQGFFYILPIFDAGFGNTFHVCKISCSLILSPCMLSFGLANELVVWLMIMRYWSADPPSNFIVWPSFGCSPGMTTGVVIAYWTPTSSRSNLIDC